MTPGSRSASSVSKGESSGSEASGWLGIEASAGATGQSTAASNSTDLQRDKFMLVLNPSESTVPYGVLWGVYEPLYACEQVTLVIGRILESNDARLKPYLSMVS